MEKLKKNIIAALEYWDQHPTLSATKVGEIFKCDRHALSRNKEIEYSRYNIEDASGENPDYLYYFNDEELKIIQIYENNPDKTNVELRKLYKNFPKRNETLYNWLKILGKDSRTFKAKRYNYDRTKFSKIETEEDAYWLGFITADGCIIEHQWLGINLGAKDKDHLIKFLKYLGFEKEEDINSIITQGIGGAYTKDNIVYGVKICSNEIIQNLEDKGITPRKSNHEIPYKCKTIQLEKAYIRGILDGDGYLRSTQYGIGVVGSQAICEYIREFTSKNICDISDHIIEIDGNIHRLSLATGIHKSSLIAHYYYDDASIYLDRKYQLYLRRYKNNIAV